MYTSPYIPYTHPPRSPMHGQLAGSLLYSQRHRLRAVSMHAHGPHVVGRPMRPTDPSIWRWIVIRRKPAVDAMLAVKQGATTQLEQTMSRVEAARHAALVRWGKRQPLPKPPPGARRRRREEAAPTTDAPSEERPAETVARVLAETGIDPALADALSEYLAGQLAEEPEDLALNRRAAEALAAQGLIRIRPGQEGAANVSIDLTAAGQRLARAATEGDIAAAMRVVERGHERAARQAERQAQQEQRQAERQAQREQRAGGGRGGARGGAGDREAQRRERATETARRVGLDEGAVDTLRQAADDGGVTDAHLVSLGLVGPDGLATDQGRRALSALERGDPRGYHAALQDAAARLERERQRALRQAVEASARGERALTLTQQLDAVQAGLGRLDDAGHFVLGRRS